MIVPFIEKTTGFQCSSRSAPGQASAYDLDEILENVARNAKLSDDPSPVGNIPSRIGATTTTGLHKLIQQSRHVSVPETKNGDSDKVGLCVFFLHSPILSSGTSTRCPINGACHI